MGNCAAERKRFLSAESIHLVKNLKVGCGLAGIKRGEVKVSSARFSCRSPAFKSDGSGCLPLQNPIESHL